MGLDYHASSPCLVLPPSQQPSYLTDFNASHRRTSPAGRRPGSVVRKHPVPPSLNYLAAASNSAAGRKRSIHDVDPDDLPQDGSITVHAPVKPRGEPVYGPGMTLIYPGDPGFSIAADSQTGTWAEEKHEREEKEKPAARPIAVSRKSQRVENSPSVKVAPQLPTPESIIDERGNTIDALITALGIGWKNIMTNEVLSDATRAYTRVIENHFPLTEPAIMLEKEALSAYLVRAKQDGIVKFWLFHDSLSWCQLIGNTLQQAVDNLKVSPVPHVEGPQIFSTPRTPSESPATHEVDMGAISLLTSDEPMQL